MNGPLNSRYMFTKQRSRKGNGQELISERKCMKFRKVKGKVKCSIINKLSTQTYQTLTLRLFFYITYYLQSMLYDSCYEAYNCIRFKLLTRLHTFYLLFLCFVFVKYCFAKKPSHSLKFCFKAFQQFVKSHYLRHSTKLSVHCENLKISSFLFFLQNIQT